MSLLLTLAATVAPAAGVTGRGGLEAVAVSADGKLVAVGGQNRVVYVLDADKVEVTKRLYHGARIGTLAFTKDGKRLVIEDETDRITLLDIAAGKPVAKLDAASGLVAHAAIDRAVVRDAKDVARHRLKLLELTKLEEVAVAELPDRPIAWALAPDGKSLAALGSSRPCDEKRVPASEVPRELTGLARWTYRQRHDGVEAAIYHVELPTGKVGRVTRTWYTSDSDTTQVAQAGDRTYLFNRVNLCARVEKDGTTALFETAQGVNHALVVSADAKLMLTGGLGEGSLSVLGADGRNSFRLDALAGQSEFFNRFAFAADGSAWGVTTSYRVVRINRFGRVERVEPVY